MKRFTLIWIVIALGACANYRVTVNDNDWVNPREPFTAYAISDSALAECVAAAIADQKITQASGLTQLNCSKRGIRGLAGIEIFSSLRYLDLRGNQISSVAPLLTLGQLEEVNLQDNSTLLCREVGKLSAVADEVNAPQCEQ